MPKNSAAYAHAAQEKSFVVHVDAGANVIGNYGYHFPHLQCPRGIGHIHRSVFFIEPEKFRVGRLHDVSVAGFRS